MDEREIDILGEDRNYWWFKAKEELALSLVKDSYSIINLGAGAFNIEAPNVSNYRGDLTKIAIAENFFDGALLLDVLEHLDKHTKTKTLKEINRVLTKYPKGRLIISVPAHQKLFNAHDIFLGHFMRYDKKTLIKECKKAGFKLVKIRYWNSILYPLLVIWKKRNLEGSKSDFKKLPKWLNGLLYRILKLEERLVLPWGMSIIGVFEKK